MAVTLVDRKPASGRESVGGTTPAAGTDTAVADSAEAGASQGR